MPIAFLLTGLIVAGVTGDPAFVGTVDFDTQVLPLVTRAGCNAGSCHGAAAGRGGFGLSLFGGDPAADYDEIVRRLEGRRIDRRAADKSLLWAKPTGALEHGGGVILDPDDPDDRLLLQWIQQGAQRSSRTTVEELRVTLSSDVVEAVPAELDLQVEALFAGGDGRRWTAAVDQAALLTPDDPQAITLPSSRRVRVLRGGRHTLVVRFLDHVQAVQITAPLERLPASDPAAAETPLVAPAPNAHPTSQNIVDREIDATCHSLQLDWLPPASDGRWLRRVHLQLTGRLPSPEAAQRFATDTDPEKDQRLITELLDSESFIEFWTYRLAQWLRVRGFPSEPEPAAAFQQWIAQQLRQGAGWDQMALSLLDATGDSHQVGPASFYRLAAGPREQAEYFSEVFLGVRLRCANCHNHPLDRWTQDDYHGLAAIFAPIQRARVVRRLERGEVIHPRTGEPAQPKLPGGEILLEQTDAVSSLGRWLVADQNPWFARAIVNRLWLAMMGRALVEPVDDLRASNPGLHPRLLRELAEDLMMHGYDIRRTLRQIACSNAFRRRSAAGNDAVRVAYFAAYPALPLAAEVLADALTDVTAVPAVYGDLPQGTRAIALADPRLPAPSLDVLGRCARDSECRAEGAAAAGLRVTLHLLNGPLVNDKLSAPGSRLHAWLQRADAQPDEIVDDFYLRALARTPSAAEQEFWLAEWSTADDKRQRLQFWEDFLWSLLSCHEFTHS